MGSRVIALRRSWVGALYHSAYSSYARGVSTLTLELPPWVETYLLTDVWRHFHPHTWEYTCHSTTYKALSRIDLVLASSTALQWVRGVHHLSRGISDHAPVCPTLSLTDSPGGCGVSLGTGLWDAGGIVEGYL